MPTRTNRPAFDPIAYRQRNIIERAFCRLKDWRAIATRYGPKATPEGRYKTARNFLAGICLAAAVTWWISCVHTLGRYARHLKTVPRPGACHVKQVAFRLVDLFQICLIRHRLDARSVTALTRACNGRTSSSQAITATVRNSSPFDRYIGLIETAPGAPSTFSFNSTASVAGAFTAAQVRAISACERTRLRTQLVQ